PASGSGLRAYGAFGLAYGLASLGCAFPLFFALVGTAIAAGGVRTAIIAFVLYGAGMATVLGCMTLAAPVGSVEILARVRWMARSAPLVGGCLLLLSGGYIVYYWLSAGRLLIT